MKSSVEDEADRSDIVEKCNKAAFLPSKSSQQGKNFIPALQSGSRGATNFLKNGSSSPELHQYGIMLR
jgi:hypothetical protein